MREVLHLWVLPVSARWRDTCVSLADLFSCFNGGECVHPAFCDCRRFNATGPRCQMGESGLHPTLGGAGGTGKAKGLRHEGLRWERNGGGPARARTHQPLAWCPLWLRSEVLFSLAQCTMPALRGTASAGRGDSTMWRRLMASTTTSLGRAATRWRRAMNPRGRPSRSR